MSYIADFSISKMKKHEERIHKTVEKNIKRVDTTFVKKRQICCKLNMFIVTGYNNCVFCHVEIFKLTKM